MSSVIGDSAATKTDITTKSSCNFGINENLNSKSVVCVMVVFASQNPPEPLLTEELSQLINLMEAKSKQLFLLRRYILRQFSLASVS